MSHPTDGDRFSTQQPEEGAWNEQPHSQPEASQHQSSPHEAPQASGPGQQDSSCIPGPVLLAGTASEDRLEQIELLGLTKVKIQTSSRKRSMACLYITTH